MPEETEMEIKVLATDRTISRITVALIRRVAEEKGVSVDIEEVEDLERIVNHGVFSIPAVVIDGKVVHAGTIPGHETIDAWLS